jgi:hypothetical protein
MDRNNGKTLRDRGGFAEDPSGRGILSRLARRRDGKERNASREASPLPLIFSQPQVDPPLTAVALDLVREECPLAPPHPPLEPFVLDLT